MIRFSSTLLVASTLLSTAFAFSASSSFVGRRHVLYNAAPSTSMLQMNLFDRFQRVAKANLNNVLQSLEDPEKIMTQALEDMQVRRLCVIRRMSVDCV
jgi:PspA/IM30 family